MSPMSAPPLKPQLTLPEDEGLPRLPLLFDNKWVWQVFCQQFGSPDDRPDWIRLRRIHYQPGVQAIISYVAERKRGKWIVEDEFAVKLVAGKSDQIFSYPDDPYLPGLRRAASGPDAHQILTKYVPISPHRLRVESVRYRPASRAVLRHIASWRKARTGKVTFFARVMPPARVPRFLTAAVLAEHSGFALPRLAGCWAEGGVVWLPQVSGNTVRTEIQQGTPPDPEQILDGLEKLWSAAVKPDNGHRLDLSAGFHMTRRLLSHLLQGEEARRLLQAVTDILGPFSEAWQPSALAHNDFYDDQIFRTPDGQLVLVDFEEMGPGDPLFDVGNMLAHLHWMARFGIAPEACDAYHHCFRSTALDRFGWEPQALDLREALAIFRLSANPFHQLQRGWATTVETGLSLVAEVLAGAP